MFSYVIRLLNAIEYHLHVGPIKRNRPNDELKFVIRNLNNVKSIILLKNQRTLYAHKSRQLINKIEGKVCCIDRTE